MYSYAILLQDTETNFTLYFCFKFITFVLHWQFLIFLKLTVEQWNYFIVRCLMLIALLIKTGIDVKIQQLNCTHKRARLYRWLYRWSHAICGLCVIFSLFSTSVSLFSVHLHIYHYTYCSMIWSVTASGSEGHTLLNGQ